MVAAAVSYDLTYLSLGAGRQSTALGIISALGLYDCPKADVAIFADTGDEPAWVYEHLWTFAGWMEQHGIPVHVVSAGHLSADLAALQLSQRSRIATVPAFSRVADGSAAPLRRQCTREYKIEPIERYVRRVLLGTKPRCRVKGRVKALIGISLDECDRMKPSRASWIDNAFPLIDARLKLQDCKRIIGEQGIKEPGKSSCVFCPYHGDTFWRELKRDHPTEFSKAVAFDGMIRNMSKNGVRNPLYLHRSLRPLAEVSFGENQGDLFSEECSGVCGV